MTKLRRITFSEADFVLNLQRRYPSPEWCLLPQVRNATGYSRTVRTADAIAINTWPSRGMEIHGFECKSYRNDWIRELRDPDKSSEIQRFCDRWWIVAAPWVVRRNEDPVPFPPTWGLLVMDLEKGGLIVEVDAPKLQPEPVTKDFLAAVLRAAHGYACPDRAIKDAHGKGFREGRDSAEKSRSAELKYAEEALHSLEEKVRRFEQASGVSGLVWNAERIGEAVRAVLQGNVTVQLERQLMAMSAVVQSLEAAIAELQTGKAAS